MSISEADYEMHYWPKLECAIQQLLTMTPGSYIPLSYEQMYSCVYKCVCKQFSERLYSDLLKHMSRHCEKLNNEVNAQMENPIQFILAFSRVVEHYLQSLHGIVPIFNYMNRFYVESKLKLDLLTELKKMFAEKCVNGFIGPLLDVLDDVSQQPFAVYPPAMAGLVKNLYSLNPGYANMKPSLFAKYIPNILPPTSVSEMDKYIAEAHDMQQKIRESPEFEMCSRQKRSCEDDATIS